ncbi:E3 ubiquitin-protein ligase TRIM71-like isoform X2 [Belonocnema kinseyi]|uniref:E3 ubiquitin-protein ligase TRIM71-like isoform X2 n=1 Tax=Belonocnema kinseyi TaxID=2817044 RepID=UPI00143DED58|nr:E3 ubiquitin-protein ligase TRIM71-like isoform X2 [Belonocnema kinseyi]
MGQRGNNSFNKDFLSQGLRTKSANYNRTKPKSRSSKSSMSDIMDTARSTPSPCILSPQSYIQTSPLESPHSPDSFSSIYPRVLEVINGDQFQRCRSRLYSPFNECTCTISAECEYCASRFLLQVFNNLLTPERMRSLSTSTGTQSPPLQSRSPRLTRVVCDCHPCAQYYYCQTCCKTICGGCDMRNHGAHELENLDEAIEKVEMQANLVYSEALNNIKALNKEMDDLSVAANTLELRAKQATEDVLNLVKLLRMGFDGRQHTLLNEIEEKKICQMTKLQTRDQELRNTIMFLRNTTNRLYSAMEAAKSSINPFPLILMKDMAISDIYKIQQFRRNLLPIENWMSFNVNSDVEQLTEKLGSITLDNPGSIGDRRPVKGRGDCSGSVSPTGDKPLIPVPGGNAVSGNSSPVIVWTEWYRPPKHYTRILGFTGHPADSLCRPWGVACDKFGHVIVSDRSNHRIQIYGEDGSFVRRFGKQGRLQGEFDRPAGVAVDAQRRIVVADKDNHRIQIFTMEGTFLHTFGGKGSNHGQFIYPWDVAVNSECQIVVSDTRNNRVQMFSPQGIFLKSFGSLSDLKTLDLPRGVCFNPEGNVLVSDFNNHRIIEIDSDFVSSKVVVRQNDKLKPISRPQGIAADDKGNIIIVDSRNHRVQIRNKAGLFRRHLGSYGTYYNQMDRPAGVALTASGRIVVVDFGNNRVLIL